MYSTQFLNLNSQICFQICTNKHAGKDLRSNLNKKREKYEIVNANQDLKEEVTKEDSKKFFMFN